MSVARPSAAPRALAQLARGTMRNKGGSTGKGNPWIASRRTTAPERTPGCAAAPPGAAARPAKLRFSRGLDEDLRLQFEAMARLDDEGKAPVKALLEAALLRQEARRWAAAR